MRTVVLLAMAALAAPLFAQPAADHPAGGDRPMPPEPPGGGPRREMRRLDRPPRAMESVTFLGVETLPVSSTLVAQLGLPENAGLIVGHIVPGSAAAAALKEHDILLRLDDQILIDSHQLAVLVRNHKEGDEVTLTYVRGGKQATARVKLTKHDVPKFSAMFPPLPPEPPRADTDRMLSLIEQAHRGGPAMSLNRHPNGPRMHGVAINVANSNFVYRDDKGSLELTMKEGEKNLVAKDAKGAQVFAGPVTTPEQRAALPADLRERLEKLESMQGVSFRTDGDFKDETKLPGEQMQLRRFRHSPDSPDTVTL